MKLHLVTNSKHARWILLTFSCGLCCDSSHDILTGNWSTNSENATEKQGRQLRLLKSVPQELASKSKMKWKDLQSQYHLPWSHTCFIIDRNSWATRIIDIWSRNKKNIGSTNKRRFCAILIKIKIRIKKATRVIY